MEKMYWSPDEETFPRVKFINVDFIKKTIGRENGIRKIKAGDLEEISHAITQVVKNLESRNKDIDSKLNQKEESVNIPIENGYKIRKKPSPALREKLILEKKDNVARIKELKSFDVDTLVQ